MKSAVIAIGAVAALGAVVAALLLLRTGPAMVIQAPAGTHGAGFVSWRQTNWAALTGRVQLMRRLTIRYRAHTGATLAALVVLPRWYGPANNPPIPLVISPHGRGVEPGANADIWGNLPALGSFAVVNPEGQGSRLEAYSWGDEGQIADLAKMPRLVTQALPWLRIAPHRVYAIGGSMGGQETLLLLAKHSRLLAGAISFDAPTNMAARYTAFPQLRNGFRLQELARIEFGSVPRRNSDAYADRSPIFYAREIAGSGVPLQIWWSTRDRIVVNQASESGLLYRAIRHLNPHAPVSQFVGTWGHTAEMRPTDAMPIALERLGLLRFAPARRASP